MRNERKVAFQAHRIAELEQMVQELETENKSLAHELEVNKRTLLLKDETIEKLTKEVESMRENYSADIAELNSMKSDLKNAVMKARSVEREYSKKASVIIERMQKQK